MSICSTSALHSHLHPRLHPALAFSGFWYRYLLSPAYRSCRGIVCHNAEDEIELDALLGQVRASCLRLTHIRAPAPRFLVHLRTATG